MGERGPIPRREDELARERHRKGADQQPVTKGTLRPITVSREPDPAWHDLVKGVWGALFTSGQEDFLQDSDIAWARVVCAQLQAHINSGMRNSMVFSAIDKALGSLLYTEGDRRRVRLELHAEKTESRTQADAVEGYENVLKMPAARR